MIAKKRIEEETGYKLGFEVDFEKVNSKSFNMINFKIFSDDAKEIVDNTTEWYKMVFLMLKNRTYYNATDNRAQVVADTIRDQGQMRSAYEKLSRLDDYLTSGQYKNKPFTLENFIRMSHKILKEDFGIVLDEIKKKVKM